MGDQHSFDVYIRNNWVYESQINNAHSFDSYIRNAHSFEITISGLSAEPSTELYWVLNIDHKYHIVTSNVLQDLGLNLDVDVPEVSISIDEDSITFIRSVAESLDISISAPAITSVMELTQLMGSADINMIMGMGATFTEAISTTGAIEIGFGMEVVMSSSTYYMLDDYDAELLSDLDDSLLSAMDSVEA